MEYLAHSASLHSGVKDAPSKPGIKHLVEKAKARTGIATDTDLIKFALANIALEDKFAETFKAARGTVDRDLDLTF